MSSSHQWTHLALFWNPSQDLRYRAHRKQSRPKLRWIDDIRNHVKQHMDEQLGQDTLQILAQPNNTTARTTTNNTTNISTNISNRNIEDAWVQAARNSQLWEHLLHTYAEQK
eukprot:9283782-Karenia_brevis.AAC.1